MKRCNVIKESYKFVWCVKGEVGKEKKKLVERKMEDAELGKDGGCRRRRERLRIMPEKGIE
jgi:hypothetical protein